MYKHVYRNENPGKKETGDCVIRAIATATGKSWLEVFDDLTALARAQYSVLTHKDVFTRYLDERYKRVPVMHKEKGKNKRHTARTIAKMDDKGVYIIRVANHLTVLYEGVNYDLWDAGDRAAYIIWKVR